MYSSTMLPKILQCSVCMIIVCHSRPCNSISMIFLKVAPLLVILKCIEINSWNPYFHLKEDYGIRFHAMVFQSYKMQGLWKKSLDSST